MVCCCCFHRQNLTVFVFWACMECKNNMGGKTPLKVHKVHIFEMMNWENDSLFRGHLLMTLKQMNYWVWEMRCWAVRYCLCNILTFLKIKLGIHLFSLLFSVIWTKMWWRSFFVYRILISLYGRDGFSIWSPVTEDESRKKVYLSMHAFTLSV